MKLIPLYHPISLGARIQWLALVSPNSSLKGTNGSILPMIEGIIEDAKLFDLKVTFSELTELKQFADKIKVDPEKKSLTSSEISQLKEIAEDVNKILAAESKVVPTVLLREKRYKTEKLLGCICTLFAKDVYIKLSDIAAYDMTEAARCIAVNRYTAAAFHALRATEECLKQIYFLYIKRNRVKTPMWGNMVAALKDKKTNRPPAELIELLDMIRKNFRNPTQHPDKIYGEADSQDLFNLCITAINLMYKSAPPIKSPNNPPHFNQPADTDIHS